MGSGDMKEEYKELFLEESEDQLREWEEGLLELEKNPEDKEIIDRIFRAIHTLKGSAGFVGFEKLQRITHDIESELQDVRDGKIAISQEIIEVLFEALDICQKMIEAFGENREIDVDINDFLTRIRSFENGKSNQGDKERESTGSYRAEPDKNGDKTYVIDLEIEAPQREAYLRALLLKSRIEEIGQIVSINPPIEDIGGVGDDFSIRITVKTARSYGDVANAVNIDLVKVNEIKSFGEIQIAEEDKGEEKELEDKQKEEVSINSDEKTDSVSDGEVEKKKVSNRIVADKKLTGVEEVVRVPVEKLDVMLNLVGELVVQNSGFMSVTSRLKSTYGRNYLVMELEEKTESLAKIARDLQDAVMKVRMLPVGSVFNRFYRVVRDLARVRNKDIDLAISGEDTEIDKKIIDRIGEPLVHLVRNAVDHGIETKEERIRMGKPEKGLISMSAYQEGDHICIEVSDDGRGLDREEVLEKAFEKGLIRAKDAEDMSNEEVYQMIFLPGFSTASEITDISGRGVGLDVVKSTVEEMGGSVYISSRKGRGTTVKLTLPLTMAIISAILVESDHSLFAIPLSSVREVIKISGKDFKTIQTSRVIKLRDEVVTVVYLSELLGISGNGHGYLRDEIPVVIVDYSGGKIGVGVERLIGNEEIVIKSLSKHYREIDGLVGASILGDGRIVLIIDCEALIKNYLEEKKSDLLYVNADSQEQMDIMVEPEESEGSVNILFENYNDMESTESGSDEIRAEEKSPDEILADFPDKSTKEFGDDLEGIEQSRDLDSQSQSGEKLDKEPYEEISEDQIILIEELHTNGAVNASISMSQLLERDVRVSFPSTKLVEIGNVASELGGEENPVGGVYVGIDGDINGGILIVLPYENILQFCDFLFRRDQGSTEEIGDDETSAILEMANILSASFINSVAESAEIKVMSKVPEISIDMCQSVIDSILIRFNRPGNKLLLTKAEIYLSEEEQAVCYILLFIEDDSMSMILKSVENSKIRK